jgi:hypothetical protein
VTTPLTWILKLMSWAFCTLEIACRCPETEMFLPLIVVTAIPYGYGVDLWNLYLDDVIIFLKVRLLLIPNCFIRAQVHQDRSRSFHNLLPWHALRETIYPPSLPAHQPRPHLPYSSLLDRGLRDYIHLDFYRYSHLRLFARRPLLELLYQGKLCE